jgi:uncharacterized protein YndB with AHSA1/START domain
MTTQGKTAGAVRRRITFERVNPARIEDVWELWTTKHGIESWWGPDGFTVVVHKLELRPGGEMLYAMTATAPAQVDFMKQAGMPLTSSQRVTFSEVVSQRRLAFTSVVDFIPDVEPYEVATLVELHPVAQGVRMVVTIGAMHDELWTQRAVMGWESQLGKLAKVIAA